MNSLREAVLHALEKANRAESLEARLIGWGWRSWDGRNLYWDFWQEKAGWPTIAANGNIAYIPAAKILLQEKRGHI